MDEKKLAKHIRLCKQNLNSLRVRCCAECPFEEEIVQRYPEYKERFEAKRRYMYGHGV